MVEYQQLLNKYDIKCDINMLESIWCENTRHYHNLDHLKDLFNQIDETSKNEEYSETDIDTLRLSALFHDIVYDVNNNDNEIKSNELFLSLCNDKNNPVIKDVSQIILDTETHIPTNRLSELFCTMDMDILNRDFNSLLNWEKGIYEEYKSYEAYKFGRILFLNECLDKYPLNQENLLELIKYVSDNY